jgi:hypothetical protein
VTVPAVGARSGRTGPSNKRMQLTKLRAAPVLQAEVPPCAPAGQTDGGTASQLIRSVGQTQRRGGKSRRMAGERMNLRCRLPALREACSLDERALQMPIPNGDASAGFVGDLDRRL